MATFLIALRMREAEPGLRIRRVAGAIVEPDHVEQN